MSTSIDVMCMLSNLRTERKHSYLSALGGYKRTELPQLASGYVHYFDIKLISASAKRKIMLTLLRIMRDDRKCLTHIICDKISKIIIIIFILYLNSSFMN